MDAMAARSPMSGKRHAGRLPAPDIACAHPGYERDAVVNTANCASNARLKAGRASPRAT
ncbi:hypothetical protein ABIG06_000817 [Bradyrhizobium sp. USDA 326]